MIFYGTNSTHIKSEGLLHTCTHCGTVNNTTAQVYANYLHIFWIPTFPTGKYVATHCSHCQLVLQEKQMPASLKEKALPVKQQSKTPLSSFVGLLVLAVLFAGIIIFGVFSSNKTIEYLAKPQIGDVYYYKKDGSFSSMKIAEIETDSIFFFVNEYEIEKRSSIYKIDKPENYDTAEVYSYSKNELIELNVKNEVIQVKRK